MRCPVHNDGEEIKINASGKKYGFQNKADLYFTYYQKYLQDGVFVPVVPVKVRSDQDGKFSEEVLFVVDSSTEYTYIPHDVAVKLGIDFRNETPTASADGNPCCLKKIQLKIDNFDPSVIVAAIPNQPKVELPCLGLQTIFDNLVFAIGTGCTRVIQKTTFIHLKGFLRIIVN